MTAPDILTVTDLKVQFPLRRGLVRAVDGINLRVGQGEAVGLVGESGSGKSMSALSLASLVPQPGRIASGSIRLNGKDLVGMSEPDLRRMRMTEVGVIFQDAGAYLNPIMLVEDQLLEAIGKRGSRRPEDRQAVLAALKSVQIPDPARVAGAYPHQLSGGMQQRVMIASVLIRRPSLIIADEPTTALDATVQYQVLKVLAELQRELNTSLLLISHDLAVIANVCDRVYVMYGGQIVEEGRTDRVFEAPQHPYTQALVDSILDPFDPKPEVYAIEGSPPDMADPPAGCRFAPRCSKRFERCSAMPPLIPVAPGSEARCWLRSKEGRQA